MSEQRMVYVEVEYQDVRKVTHKRGSAFSAPVDDHEINELIYRGVLSLTPIRRVAGENSTRVTGEQQK